MIEKVKTSSGNMIWFEFHERLTEADLDEVLLPSIEDAVRRYGNARVLLDVEDLEGLTAGVGWLRFSHKTSIREVEQIAIVGKEEWRIQLTYLAEYILGLRDTEIRFFREDQKAEAWMWLRQGRVYAR
ncbi:MAG TPA: STAS/SEC14 domain-containing protein [Methanomicrobiales archaeon]|nr:STAS/SEC14 domain-containing protein [Methanomicrobiales archaeon]